VSLWTGVPNGGTALMRCEEKDDGTFGEWKRPDMSGPGLLEHRAAQDGHTVACKIGGALRSSTADWKTREIGVGRQRRDLPVRSEQPDLRHHQRWQRRPADGQGRAVAAVRGGEGLGRPAAINFIRHDQLGARPGHRRTGTSMSRYPARSTSGE